MAVRAQLARSAKDIRFLQNFHRKPTRVCNISAETWHWCVWVLKAERCFYLLFWPWKLARWSGRPAWPWKILNNQQFFDTLRFASAASSKWESDDLYFTSMKREKKESKENLWNWCWCPRQELRVYDHQERKKTRFETHALYGESKL